MAAITSGPNNLTQEKIKLINEGHVPPRVHPIQVL